MNKTSISTILIWIVLAIIMVVGQIVGVNPFFVICNDIFCFLNGVVIIALIPTLIQYFKDKNKEQLPE